MLFYYFKIMKLIYNFYPTNNKLLENGWIKNAVSLERSVESYIYLKKTSNNK